MKKLFWQNCQKTYAGEKKTCSTNGAEKTGNSYVTK